MQHGRPALPCCPRPSGKPTRVIPLDALTIALEATKLAIEAANDAPRRASHAQPTVPQIFESGHAANLLVHEMFENLYAQARYAIGVIKPMVTLD